MSYLPDFQSLWDYSAPAETEVAFTELLAAHADDSRDGFDQWRLELRTQVARTHSLRKEFAKTDALLNAVDADVTALLAIEPGAAPKARVRSLLERGRRWNSDGDKAQARPLFEQAWELARSAGLDGLAVDAAHMIAIASADKKQELDWGLKALKLAESSPDPDAKRWRGSLYNNLGWTHHEMGEFETALELFDKQIVVRKEAGDEPALRIARWARARALRSLGRHADALAALNEIVGTYGEEALGDGFVQEEIAENLLATGIPSRATNSFKRAHALLKDTWINDEDPARIARLAKLGGVAP